MPHRPVDVLRGFCTVCSAWLCFVCFLTGCSSDPLADPNTSDPTGRRTNYPASAFASLSTETIKRIDSFASDVPLPDPIPFSEDEALRDLYLQWYRKGYAFAFVTGAGHLRDQISRHDLPKSEQVKILGWFDGNSAGRLAKRANDIKGASMEIQGGQTNLDRQSR
jgi:hypothetical protein